MAGRGPEALLEGRHWLGGPPGGLGGVRRPTWKGWVGSGGPPGRLERVGRGRKASLETLPEDLQWSGGSPGTSGAVRSPSWRARRGRKVL